MMASPRSTDDRPGGAGWDAGAVLNASVGLAADGE